MTEDLSVIKIKEKQSHSERKTWREIQGKFDILERNLRMKVERFYSKENKLVDSACSKVSELHREIDGLLQAKRVQKKTGFCILLGNKKCLESGKIYCILVSM